MPGPSMANSEDWHLSSTFLVQIKEENNSRKKKAQEGGTSQFQNHLPELMKERPYQFSSTPMHFSFQQS